MNRNGHHAQRGQELGTCDACGQKVWLYQRSIVISAIGEKSRYEHFVCPTVACPPITDGNAGHPRGGSNRYGRKYGTKKGVN